MLGSIKEKGRKRFRHERKSAKNTAMYKRGKLKKLRTQQQYGVQVEIWVTNSQVTRA